MAAQVRLEEWSDSDLDLLRRKNAPEMKTHLGGPETEEQVLNRHQRYLKLGGSGTGRMFRVVLLPGLEVVGSIGYWERVWHGQTVYETGWGILPEYQGRGLAVAAALAAAGRAAEEHKHRWLHAYPGVEHAASNAVCRRAGFELVAEVDFEYPPGTVKRSNDWRLDLTGPLGRTGHP